jgi:hypothetical protein
MWSHLEGSTFSALNVTNLVVSITSYAVALVAKVIQVNLASISRYKTI